MGYYCYVRLKKKLELNWYEKHDVYERFSDTRLLDLYDRHTQMYVWKYIGIWVDYKV